MTPSAAEAQGLSVLTSIQKHPLRQTESHLRTLEQRGQLVSWRAAWADVTNRYLERAGREERIDHRSNAAEGWMRSPPFMRA